MVNYFNAEVFHKNLDLLRSLTGHGKGRFCKLLKIGNAYRKDIRSLGPKISKSISDNFQGVDDNWLLSEHPEGADGIIFTPRKLVTDQGKMKASTTPESESEIFKAHRLLLEGQRKELDSHEARIQAIHNETIKRLWDTIMANEKRILRLENAISEYQRTGDRSALKKISGTG